MAVKFSNNAVTTLSASISSGATSFSVASASLFPTLSGVDWTYITIDGEVIKITAISGTTFTCDATSTSHSSGVNVELRMTAELLNDFAEDSDIYTHPTGEGDKHIPAGGATDQYLKYTSSGTAVWSTVTAGVNLTSATTTPSSPTAGDQWFDTANGILYAYMTDGTDSQWIDISSSNGQAAAASAGGGAMEFISKTTVSSSVATIEISLPTGYDRFEFRYDLESTSRAHIYFQYSQDNGSSYLVTQYKVSSQNNSYSYSLTSTSANYSGVILADRAKFMHGTINMYKASATTNTRYHANSGTHDGASYSGTNQVASGMSTSQSSRINKVKFVATGAYVYDSGTISLYGIKDS